MHWVYGQPSKSDLRALQSGDWQHRVFPDSSLLSRVTYARATVPVLYTSAQAYNTRLLEVHCTTYPRYRLSMVWLGTLELTTVTLTAVELTIVVVEGDNSAGCHKGRRKHKGHRASTKGIEIFLCLKNCRLGQTEQMWKNIKRKQRK